MGKMTNDTARKNSQMLVQRALQRKNEFCSISSISMQQTSARNVPKKTPYWAEKPKAVILKPKICKPQV